MITIFDLRASTPQKFLDEIQQFYNEPVRVERFSDEEIKACIGCWSCWLKTPGKCVFKDALAEKYQAYMDSDTVILLMDTAQGFINHKAKAFFDRIIVLYHPYLVFKSGEFRHKRRYKSYPNMVFHFETDDLTPSEVQCIKAYLVRSADHYRSKAYILNRGKTLECTPLKKMKAQRGVLDFKETSPMKKLVVYNGSPRRTHSNSKRFLDVLSEKMGARIEVRDLKDYRQWDVWAKAFESDENVMFFMPLYVHAMPSHVMDFMERLSPSKGSIAYFIQSGFPESSQSHYLEAYFEVQSQKLDRVYLGTVIKGGVESLRFRPEKSQEKLIQQVYESVETLIETGSFDKIQVRRLSMPVRFGLMFYGMFKFMVFIGLFKGFWDKQLKANQAYEMRHDRPYKKSKG